MKKGLKTFLALTIAVLMVLTISATALAHGGKGHGHGHGGSSHHKSSTKISRHAKYTLCTVEDCTEIGPHQHDGDWYCSQDGHTGNYAVCTVDGCTKVGLHKHDGTYYYCQNECTGLGIGKSRNR